MRVSGNHKPTNTPLLCQAFRGLSAASATHGSRGRESLLRYARPHIRARRPLTPFDKLRVSGRDQARSW